MHFYFVFIILYYIYIEIVWFLICNTYVLLPESQTEYLNYKFLVKNI